MIGEHIAHYRILEKLGEGGMGVVYKALDTHLDRFVAIKVLPASRMADPERRRRFVQEAKAASALNHPNIVTIHDIDESGGSHYIAMECVAGKTLDRLIGRNGMPLKEALPLAIQMADALGKAHAAGIVHRDLKPSNIMVSDDGLVKILDFGLAKLVEREQPAESFVTRTMPRTPVTEEGKVIGTLAYMSPEQAEGKPVDARSDIFSFGVVLYEMLTGKRPFTGETGASTMAAIIARDPVPPGNISGPLPPELERAILRCLRKDPQRRWQSMPDLKVALQDVKEESESGAKTASLAEGAVSKRRKRMLAAVGAGVLAILAGAAVWRFKPQTAPKGSFGMERLTFEPGLAFWPALSPDGKLLAYSSDRTGWFNLYVRQPGGRQAIPLTHGEHNDWFASFSLDGLKIVFRSERDGGGIYVIDALGGTERKIVDGGETPAFSPDGSTIVYLSCEALTRRGRLFLVPANGGTPRPLQPQFIVPPAGGGFCAPLWSPDGKFVLFDGIRGGDPKTRGWWMAPAAGGDALPLAGAPPPVRWTARFAAVWRTGYFYYSQGEAIGELSLYRVPLAQNPWRVTGPPEKVASTAGLVIGASMSREGRAVFASMTPGVNVWSVPLSANQGTSSGQPQPVTSDSLEKEGLAVAGSRMAYGAYQASTQRVVDVHLRDLATGKEELIPGSGNWPFLSPRLSADGSRLSYRDALEGTVSAFLAGSGAAPGRKICDRCFIQAFFNKSDELLVQAQNRLVRMNAAGAAAGTLLEGGSYVIADAALSPADRWLAFTILRNGVAEMYLAPVTAQTAPRESWIKVAEDGSYLGVPAWSPDGNLLYYASKRDGYVCIWAERISAGGRPSGTPAAAFHNHSFPLYQRAHFGLTPDRLYFMRFEMKGNLWSVQLEGQ